MRPISCSISIFFFSSRRRHTRLQGDWSSDVCSSDLSSTSSSSPRRTRSSWPPCTAWGRATPLEVPGIFALSRPGWYPCFLSGGGDREGGYSSGVRGDDDHVRVRRGRSHPLDPARHPGGDLLEVPPLLHRQAEARGHGRARRALPAEVQAAERVVVANAPRPAGVGSSRVSVAGGAEPDAV